MEALEKTLRNYDKEFMEAKEKFKSINFELIGTKFISNKKIFLVKELIV